MSSEGTIAVAAFVVALVQLMKWAGLRDSWGPLAVILLSVAGVLLWLVSGDSWPPARTDVWPILTGIIAVTLSAAGTFGFTRAAASAVISAAPPPGDGAGSSPTIKVGDDPVVAMADQIDALSEMERAVLRVELERRHRASTEPAPLISKPPTWLSSERPAHRSQGDATIDALELPEPGAGRG